MAAQPEWIDGGQPAVDTAIIFVHGLFGDGTATWTASGPSGDAYWPRLLRGDRRFHDPAVFVANYTAHAGAGDFGVMDAVEELRQQLANPGVTDPVRPLDKSAVLFVAHSLGGVVARALLHRHQDLFHNKVVGLALFASPTRGSQVSDFFDSLLRFYHLQLARELGTNSEILIRIEERFSGLRMHNRFRGLAVAEYCEHRLTLPRYKAAKWIEPLLPRMLKIVSRNSSSVYDGARVVPDTDHITIAKPASPDHPSHRALVDFYLNEFKVLQDAPVRPASAAASPVILPSGPARGSERLASVLAGECNSLVEFGDAVGAQSYTLHRILYDLSYYEDFTYHQRVEMEIQALHHPLNGFTIRRGSTNVPVDDPSAVRPVAQVLGEHDGRSIFVVPIKESPTRRDYLILFQPAVAVGEMVRVAITNDWPRGGQRLDRPGEWDALDYLIPSASAGPVPSFELVIQLPSNGKQFRVRYSYGEQTQDELGPGSAYISKRSFQNVERGVVVKASVSQGAAGA